MDITGKVIAILPIKGGTSRAGNEWKSQEYVIETHDQYPKKICFEVYGADKISQFAIRQEEELRVHFDIDSREWNGKWYTRLRAWKVERVAENYNAISSTVPDYPPQEDSPF
jgi:hypothetical protein